MKRIKLHFFTALTMALLALTATAHDFEVDGIYYNINGTEATVTYKGSSEYEYINEYTGSVNIPATVTFGGTSYSVTTIGSDAFSYCRGLTSVTIPNSVTAIGDYAFYECSGLISFSIPNSVTTIGKSAFYGTTWYDIQPDGLVYAGRVAYEYKGTMPSGTSITIKEGTVSISPYAFCDCNELTSIDISNSVTTIGYYAFYSCWSLTNLEIPNSVTTIEYGAFFGCSGLNSISIPNSVTTIGSGAFSGCSGLTSISVESENPNYDSRNNCNAIIETASNTLIAGCMSATIPNSVKNIGNSAFRGCIGLTSIDIPNSVKNIGNSAFRGCIGLTSIDIPNSVTTIGDYAFYECSELISFTIPNSVTTIGNSAFSGTAWYDIQPDGLVYAGRVAYKYKGTMPSGISINIIEGTVSISPYAFSYCSGLTSVTFPNSVTTIGERAFYSCWSLTNLEIPNSVTTIEYGAFFGCSGLNSITCLAVTPPQSNYAFSSEITGQATLYVPRRSVAAYQIANNWQDFYQIIGFLPFDEFEVDGVWYRALDESTAMVIPRPDEEYYQGDVVIPETVAFESYTFTVVAIDEGAFEDCYDLNSVVIGDAVEVIGVNAFQGCTGLTSVTIGSGVTSIGAKAFNYCNALQTVTCRGTVPPVMASSNCFSNAAYSRAVLKVPRPEIETYAATDYWYKFSHIEGWGYLGPGDVNGNGIIDMDDLTLMINIMLTEDFGGINPSWADVNGNGIVSMNDLTELINLLLTQ